METNKQKRFLCFFVVVVVSSCVASSSCVFFTFFYHTKEGVNTIALEKNATKPLFQCVCVQMLHDARRHFRV